MKADRPHLKGLAQFPRQRDDMAHALERIISVDQEDRLGVERRERPERLHLVRRRLDEAVRHGARHGHAINLAGERVRGRGHAGDVERPRRVDRCVDAVHAARAEVDHAASHGRRYDACRLGGENRLQMHLVHHEGLGELRLRDRRADLQNWLVREDRRALGQGIEAMASDGLRVLALASRRVADPYDRSRLEQGLTLLGLVGLRTRLDSKCPRRSPGAAPPVSR